MTKIRFKGKLYLGIGLAILLVLILGVLSYITSIKEREAEGWESHTFLVKAKLQEININIKDNAASYRAKRRYRDMDQNIMSGVGRESVVYAVNELRNLVKDNNSQYARGVKLQAEVVKLFDFWEKERIADGAFDNQAEEVIFKEEAVLLKEVTKVISEMDMVESQLLEIRRKETLAALEFNNISNIGGSLLILAVVIGLGITISMEFSKRRTAEANLNDRILEQDKLNARIAMNNEVLSASQALMEACQKTTNVPAFLQAILDGILDFSGMNSAVFYLTTDETGHDLIPMAHRGVAPENVRDTNVNMLLTKYRNEHQPIVFVENVPADFWKLTSVSGSKLPGIIVYMSIRLKGQLLGVIEFAGFQMPENKAREYLSMLPGGIAIRLAALQLTESRNYILGELQEKQEILLNQQEELRQSNEELMHQTKVLQASEEELRVQEEELKQINTELEEKHDALELAHQVMDVKASELELSTKYKSEFLANMSHELRTPLNSILILANLLGDNKDKNLSTKQVEYAKIIGNSGSDLLKLINDILDLSKIEAGKIDLTIETVGIPSVVEHMKETFQVMADQKKIDFRINVSITPEQAISTDSQRLEQILKNLLSNAIKFTSEGGTVSLDISKGQDNKVSFKVIDTGIGIDASKLDLIFEAFRQEDGSTNRKYGGTGLGLSISKELTKMLKGTLHAESHLGKGSIFVLTIPDVMTDEGPNKTGYQKTVEEASEAISNDGKDKTILIIEDDVNFSTILKNFAEERSYKTLQAGNGKVGLQMAKEHKPDAIILDLQMPIVDGWEVLKELKNNPELMGIPVHVISAMDEDKAPTEGAVEYVRKPVTIEELESTFKHIGSYLSAVKHRLLIWSREEEIDNILVKMISNLPADVKYDFVTDINEIIELGKKHHYDCILADVGSSHEDYFRNLQEIRENNLFSGTSLIVLIDTEISATDEMRLKKLSEAIVMKSKEAHNRLKDELELFMFRVKEHQPDTANTLPQQTYTDNKNLEGRKVLVADDDMRNVFALVGMLETQKMEVITASNGKEAVEALEENTDIDIVLMDIMMPEMDGYEAMRNIRAIPRFKKLPIIALTAKAMSNDRELCIEAGASDYMSKPVNTQKLLSLIRIWLS